MFRSTVIFCCFLTITQASKLGSLVTEKCPEWGEISADCYAQQLNNIIAGISQGVPSLGLPSMDPFVVPHVNVSIRGGMQQEFIMSFHAMNFTGLSKTRVANIKVGNPLRIRLHLPRLQMRTPFSTEGRLVLFRAQSEGSLIFNFAEVELEFTVKYDEERRGDQRFAVIEGGNVKVDVKRSIIQLERLENANQLTQELFNVFLSASGDDIIQALLPYINEAFTERFLTVARNTVANLPLSDIFKPWEEPPARFVPLGAHYTYEDKLLG